MTTLFPRLETSTDAVQAMACVLAAVAAGELEPSAGHDLAGIIENFRRTLEVEDIEKRLTALEQRK